MDEQHPVPRQITTFEFKLIGFMTLRQFIYLLVFVPLGYVIYRLVPIFIVNIVLGFLTGGIGFVLAFVPFNDRPIDVMIKNLTRRLLSPTQYFYHKDNPALYFLESLYYTSDPHQTLAHIETQNKLAAYMANAKTQDASHGTDAVLAQKKQSIMELFLHPDKLFSPPKQEAKAPVNPAPAAADPTKPEQKDAMISSAKAPFVSGVVTNNKKTPLPGVLIYIRDQNNNPLRLLKTNPHGIFATYNQLPPGDYTFEVKDPKGTFFFDTMKLHLEQKSDKPLEFVSKELL